MLKEKSMWKHRNGNVYYVLMMTNYMVPSKEKYPLTVVYRNVINGNTFSRPFSDWHRSMTEQEVS